MKKTAQNDVTGDWLHSKPNNEMFEENFDRIFRKEKAFEKLKETIEEHSELFEMLKQSRMDTVGQNGNDGLHYEYELNKSTGEVQKKED